MPWGARRRLGEGKGAAGSPAAGGRSVHFDLLPAADLRLPPALLQVVTAPDGTERLSAKRRLAKLFRCRTQASWADHRSSAAPAAGMRATGLVLRGGSAEGSIVVVQSGGLIRSCWQLVGS